jgi:predicted DNA-binding transcriptional regulator YafY
LLKAVKERRVVTFIHENFETGKHRDYTLMPYMLKEYLNRWYLIGLIEDSDIFWTFGIDRVFDLKVTDNIFTPSNRSHPSENFRHTIGLTYSTAKKQDVVLSFTPLQAKYVKALPLHWSQEIVEESERGLIIRLSIIPNLEFIQRVLMLGPNVKVLEPDWVAKEVREALQEALKQYI